MSQQVTATDGSSVTLAGRDIETRVATGGRGAAPVFVAGLFLIAADVALLAIFIADRVH